LAENIAAIGYGDLIPVAALSAEMATVSLPVRNLKDPFLSPRVWQFEATKAWFQADFTTAKSMALVGLHGTTLTSAAKWRIQAWSGATLLHDTGSTLVTIGTSGFYKGRCVYKMPAGIVGTSLRVTIEDLTTPLIRVGRATLMAKLFEPKHNYTVGITTEFPDTHRFTRTDAANNWKTPGKVWKAHALTFPAVLEQEVKDHLEPLGLLGRGTDVILLYDRSSSNLSRDSFFGEVTETLNLTKIFYQRYEAPMRIEERL
jgi:hypothetical protein